MNRRIDASDFSDLVDQLGDTVRAKLAFQHLIGAGPAALAAVRAGLEAPDPVVRMHCARALDHLVDEDTWPALLAMLDDGDARVRVHALHAIACDRCKEDGRRPDPADVLPRAIEVLREDPSYHVRAMAIEVVARFVHDVPEAAAALIAARDDDPTPMVRKKAAWNAPGGVIYSKTAGRKTAARRKR